MGRTPPNSKHLEGRYDSLAGDEFLKARNRANPYEMVKGAIFQNRAAMKMANMDAVFDFMFQRQERNSRFNGAALLCRHLRRTWRIF